MTLSPEQEKLNKLKSAQILRSLAGKSEFLRAAIEIVGFSCTSLSRQNAKRLLAHQRCFLSQARNISALRRYVLENRRDYVQPGLNPTT